MTANKKMVDDCEICTIASPANCDKCAVLSDMNDHKWVEDNVEWDKAPDKAGSLE